MKAILTSLTIFSLFFLASCEIVQKTEVPRDEEPIIMEEVTNTGVVVPTTDENQKDPAIVETTNEKINGKEIAAPKEEKSADIQKDIDSLEEKIWDTDEIMEELLNLLDNEQLPN